jgi:hypothetical protein
LLAAGLSRYEPDPLNALARVKAERAAKSAPTKFPPSGSPTTSSPQRGLKPNAFGSPQAPPSMSTPAASEESLALRLSDTQLDAVMRLCQPLALHCRDALLRILAMIRSRDPFCQACDAETCDACDLPQPPASGDRLAVHGSYQQQWATGQRE